MCSICWFCYSLAVVVLSVQSRMSARGGKKKATKLSRSARAGVIFPVGRMMRYLRTGTHKYRIGMGAPVYMAAVIEYLAGRLASHDSSFIHTSFNVCNCVFLYALIILAVNNLSKEI